MFPLAARPFYVTGCHSVSLFIPLDESEAYVSDIVRGEVSLHLRNGNLCAFTCVCALAARWESMILQQEGDHKLSKTDTNHTKAPSDHSSVTAPINHIYTAAAAAGQLSVTTFILPSY